ncbi:extracellular solute-binding protein [Streptomyces sp. NPDC002596]|uniref:extracellular solute-binding protein n=1 Tax=unclassified Streptomyces TaxID=2593676 RepID=UPI002258F5FE|nr:MULTISPECIES: extracellular solute-binding protein [unclassified Streptomyces]MCX4531302.1 extracellular solute-binding protein [Streptomyces sp. NBC_01669]WSA03112.1 extracellular solute-binding protein [Streptomyces sp. NBC_00841]
MTPNSSPASTAPSRRSFLASSAVAAVAVAGGVPLLAACGGGSGSGSKDGTTTGKALKKVLPDYIPSNLVQPDVASVNGSSPGFTKLPDPLVASVKSVPGKGSAFRIMTPLWGTVPKKNNPYYTAVNKAVGATLNFDPQDGNTYQDKIGAVLAGSDIPDVVTIPGWNMQGQIRNAIVAKFADLSPYLAGDAIKKYPNLANIPTGAWQYSVFGGKLRGLPMPSPILGNAIFYRKDLVGSGAVPASADDLLAFGKEYTDAKKKVWAFDDLWTCIQKIFGLLPDAPHYWKLENGKLVHKIETQEYREALAFARKLHEGGYVHPDAEAGKDADSKIRFTGGRVLMYNDGTGGWKGMVTEQATANPKFDMQALDFFNHDGGKPVLWQDDPAGIFTFLSKKLPKAKIEEILAVADFAAAPYGTKEFMLTNYGVQDTHYTIKDGVPTFTPQGIQEAQPSTFMFLASPPHTVAFPDEPQLVKDYAGWMARQAPNVKKPLFFGMQIVEPQRYASLYTPFDDLQKDIRRGRKKVSDVDAAVTTWKNSGGDKLRDWYQDILDKNGSGN